MLATPLLLISLIRLKPIDAVLAIPWVWVLARTCQMGLRDRVRVRLGTRIRVRIGIRIRVRILVGVRVKKL